VLHDTPREDALPDRKTHCCVTRAESDKPMLVFYTVKESRERGPLKAIGRPVPFAKALARGRSNPKKN